MSDELRAAAEYCRDKDGYAFIAGPAADCDFIDKAKAVADAYLAEHPADDGEPVTEEWLRAVGFVGCGPDELVSARCDSTGWRPIYDTDARPEIGMPLWSLSSPGCQQGVGYDLPTRGAVRRLLLALGITPTPKG